MKLLQEMKRRRRELAMAKANNIVHDEGHLGGYVRSSSIPSAAGLDVSNGDPATWTPRLWEWAITRLGVTSMLDVGCGEGHAAHYFQSHGCDVAGVDGSQSARRASKIAGVHYQHDFQLGPFQPTRTFDLVWSCEFVEHVREEFTSHFLQTFACADRYLMMTYAPPGQPGWHHVNCQPAEYWIERISRLGFRFDQPLTRTSRQQCDKGHYRSKGLLFVRDG